MTLLKKPWLALLGVVVCLALAASRIASGVDPEPEPDPPPPLNSPPSISLEGSEGLTMWTFEGQVVDEDPVGLVVTFGGLLDGHSTTITDPDGYYWYSVELTESGTVTAQTTDIEFLDSNVALYEVIQ